MNNVNLRAKAALASSGAPTGAAPAGEALLREALELAIPYLEADSQCGYDGTNGSGIRQEAQRRLDIARAALAAPTGAAPEQAAQQGLEDCRLYAARHRKEEWAKVILRLCKAGGAIGSPLRKPKGQP